MHPVAVVVSALLLAAGLCFQPAAAGELAVDAASPRYVNARYAFSLAWTPGAYSVREADNGDGITVRDGRGLEMQAYGTRGYAVLGQDFDAILAEWNATFDAVTYQHVARRAGWFVLSGYRGQHIGYLKCIVGAEAAWIVHLAYPREGGDAYAPLVSRVADTFKVSPRP